MTVKDYIHPIDITNISSDNISYLFRTDIDKILYFDIETTGLYARNTTLYLIGALWFDNGDIHIRQWFNDDGYSEKDIIHAFNEFCGPFTHLIHFNGTTFDIPYIREKASSNNVCINNIESLIQSDVFKEIRKYKNILGLNNMKQVTIEQFLNIAREDKYNGKELINIYQRYVAMPDDEKMHFLLLHNHDDLLGLLEITPILCYKKMLESPDILMSEVNYNTENNALVMEIKLADTLQIPKRFSMTNRYGIYINAIDNSVSLRIPIINDTLKHYFKDYKNYYYLPTEDMAIHKSVAAYVSPDNRRQASKADCYIKKNDNFIICFDTDFPEYFKKDINDKETYRTCESLLQSDENSRTSYIKAVLNSIFKV